MNLADNHIEYWKTIRRGGEGIQGHTIGFPWFITWPATKRTRKSPKPLKTNPLAWWHCTRKQLMDKKMLVENKEIAELRKKVSYNYLAVSVIERMNRELVTASNPRQGWDKDGNMVEWPWKE